MPKILAFEDTEARLDEVKCAMRETDDKRLTENYPADILVNHIHVYYA